MVIIKKLVSFLIHDHIHISIQIRIIIITNWVYSQGMPDTKLFYETSDGVCKLTVTSESQETQDGLTTFNSFWLWGVARIFVNINTYKIY